MRTSLVILASTALLCAISAFGQDDGLEPHLQQLVDPNAAVDRIVEHRSQQLSLKAERAGIDMKQSAPNRSASASPHRAATPTKAAVRRAATPKSVPVKPASARPSAREATPVKSTPAK